MQLVGRDQENKVVLGMRFQMWFLPHWWATSKRGKRLGTFLIKEFLIGMHRYNFFQNKVNTFIFGTCRSSTDTCIFISFVIFKNTGYRNQKNINNVIFLLLFSYLIMTIKMYSTSFCYFHFLFALWYFIFNLIAH